MNVDICADPEQHKCREEFHRHLPSAHRCHPHLDGADGHDGHDGDDGGGGDGGGGDGGDNDDDEQRRLVWNFTKFHFCSSINFDLFPHHML